MEIIEIHIKEDSVWFFDKIGEPTIVAKSELTEEQKEMVTNYLKS